MFYTTKHIINHCVRLYIYIIYLIVYYKTACMHAGVAQPWAQGGKYPPKILDWRRLGDKKLREMV